MIDGQGTAFATAADDTAQVEVEERGPLRAALSITGTHRGGADGFLDYVIRIHAWAGKPYVAVQYQFINREESTAGLGPGDSFQGTAGRRRTAP